MGVQCERLGARDSRHRIGLVDQARRTTTVNGEDHSHPVAAIFQ
jgi:hypothetical protein